MNLKINILNFYLIALFYVWNNNFNVCDGKRNIFYIHRPVIVYYNTSYVQNVTLKMKTYNRTHPFKFTTLIADIVRPLDNTFRIHFYVYELLSNVYKRSFVEYHMGICEGFSKGFLLSEMINESYNRIPESERPMKYLSCPIKPGHYELKDIKLDLLSIPPAFPFVEGRLYANATHAGRLTYCAYVDLTVKTLRH